MHVAILQFNGNPAVGLFGVVTEKYLLLGKEVPETNDEQIEEVLGLPIKRITLAGTGLIGVFAHWGNNKLLIPSIVFDHEIEALEELEVPYKIIDTELTCLGNNILSSDFAAIINPDFTDEEARLIGEALAVPVKKETICGVEAVGSIGVIGKDKGLFHRDLLPSDAKRLERLFNISITTGSINMGSPYIRSGIILSKKGFIIGATSGGPEITNADEALGFIEV